MSISSTAFGKRDQILDLDTVEAAQPAPLGRAHQLRPGSPGRRRAEELEQRAAIRGRDALEQRTPTAPRGLRSTRLRYDAEMPARSAALRSDRLRFVRAARSRLPTTGSSGTASPAMSECSAGGAKPRVSRARTSRSRDDVLGRVARWRPPARIGRTSPLRSHALSVDGLTPTRRATSPMRMSSTRTHSSTRRGAGSRYAVRPGRTCHC